METKKQHYKLSSGSYDAQGPRKTMEDTHIRIDEVHKEEGTTITNFSSVAYYGVYDGHGGVQTAEMVVDKLHHKILKSENFSSGDVQGAIQKGFEEMDQFVVEEANKQNAMHGCTCVCSLVLDDKVYFANIGDSEGLLVTVENGAITAKNMTKAHKASDPSEKDRIEKMGGHVFFGRVYGSLAVSRSFGDAKYKRPKTSQDFVSWEPHTLVETLTPIHRYMVLACDGLFDVMDHQEVAEMTHKLFQEGHDAQNVAKSLVIRAVKDLQTEDNVTVIIVKIDWPEQECAQTNVPPTSEAHTETHTHTQCHPETHANTHPDTHADTHADTHGNTHADTHADTHGNTHADTHMETHHTSTPDPAPQPVLTHTQEDHPPQPEHPTHISPEQLQSEQSPTPVQTPQDVDTHKKE